MDQVSVQDILQIAKSAGERILEIYQSDRFEIQIKADQSPVTLADQISHEWIESQLRLLTPDIPIISEEGRILEFKDRRLWKSFWLVDPLDGTKEFIKKNGEFSVNIALIQNQVPVLGVIHAPAQGLSYFAKEGEGSFKISENKPATRIFSEEKLLSEPLRVIGSRSHQAQIPEHLKSQIQIKERLFVGSAIKFGWLSESKVDLYARFSPCMEWDVAAGDALFRWSSQNDKARKSPFVYNRQSLQIDSFVIGVDEISSFS